MRVGVLSDIHANVVALEAVLSDLPEDVDRLVCAGDIVGYNPYPAACVDIVRERCRAVVQGNHDRAVAGGGAFGFNRLANAGVRYSRKHLDADRLEWLDRLPQDLSVSIDGRNVRLVHGHPDDPDRYTYPSEFDADLLASGSATPDPDILVLGHTHVQAHAVYDAGVVMNPGSVGQPRDGDPRAAYAVVDLDRLAVEERRVEYDVDRVVAAIADAGLPRRLGERLRTGE